MSQRNFYEIHCNPIHDRQGQVIGASRIVRNVTARKRAPAELARSEAELKDVQRLARFGSWEWLPETDTMTWSEELYHIYGLDPALPPPSYAEYGLLYTAESLARLNAAVERALLDGTPYELDLELVRPDGSRGWLVCHGAAVPDAFGAVVKIRGLVQDISERKKGEDALRQVNETLERRVAERTAQLAESQRQLIRRQALLSAVCEGTEEGIYVKNHDSQILLANPAVMRIVGKPAEQILGYNDAEFYDEPEIGAAIVATDRRIMASGRPETVEEVVQTPDGLRVFLSTKTPWCDEDGNVIGIMGVSSDITDRKGYEQALVEADRRKDEFLATLAHELRNPLATIQNGLHILHALGDGNGMDEGIVPMMQRQVDHPVHLVDDLMDVSRITRGKIELRKERLDLGAVVRHALEISRPLVDAGGHDPRIALPAMPLMVEGDATRLAQVVANLLGNAAKFTPKGGRIELTVEPGGSEAVIRVRDTGLGIPADMLGKVFDMFTHVDNSVARDRSGLGIGLTLVKRIVEIHGGSVEARSEGTDRGSEFTVRLPLAAAESCRDVEPPALIEGRTGPASRIVVVDDDVDAADSLARLLRIAGHEVLSVYDGPAALQRAEAFRPDLILLDIGMPVMDGYEAARRIRQTPSLRNVLLVAQTGWGQSEDRRRTREAGFDHHLIKPVDHTKLLALILGCKTAR
jgi:PAS domain S-box-containing protein